MRIIIDAMGGDNAPDEIVLGALRAAKEYGTEIVLVGRGEDILRGMKMCIRDRGLGTSMLQMGNIVKNPRIWIPATLAAAVTGPLSTMVFKLECTGVSAGMGTCGLVGPLGILADMGGSPRVWLGIVLVCIVLPAVLSWVFSGILRKIGWIRPGDLKLNL